MDQLATSTRCCSPSRAAVPLRSAVIAIAAQTADIAAISYNSCRNRHCPKCQGNARQRWLEAREGELAAHALRPRRLHAAA